MLPRVEISAPDDTYPRRHFTLAETQRLIRDKGSRFSIVDLFRREAEEAAGHPIDWRAHTVTFDRWIKHSRNCR